MLTRKRTWLENSSWGVVLLMLLTVTFGCSDSTQVPSSSLLQKLAPDQEFAGFLSDYSNLKPSAAYGGEALTYARKDAEENLHKYIAIIVDPVQVFVKTDADLSQVSEEGAKSLSDYFKFELLDAVADAFPAVDQPGPLVLRLRAAIVGVDVGGEVTDASAEQHALPRAIDIGQAGIELELVDSVTGDQIAAMVDRERLGAGAAVGVEEFSRDEKYAQVVEALNGWADRLREFLDEAHRISEEDAKRAEQVIGQ